MQILKENNKIVISRIKMGRCLGLWCVLPLCSLFFLSAWVILSASGTCTVLHQLSLRNEQLTGSLLNCLLMQKAMFVWRQCLQRLALNYWYFTLKCSEGEIFMFQTAVSSGRTQQTPELYKIYSCLPDCVLCCLLPKGECCLSWFAQKQTRGAATWLSISSKEAISAKTFCN